MENQTRRPFYDEFAWAFELLITPDVSAQCEFIAETLFRRGVAATGASVLDAGCGGGAYSIELARRGYAVTGVDLSPQLITEAQKRASDTSRSISFVVGDILALPVASTFDAVLCRGVLNDLLDEASRSEAFFSFARALRPGGVLVLDVREWEATAERKQREPVFEKTVETSRGTLTFRSQTRPEHESHRLLVAERHTLLHKGVETVSEYAFTMRCWTCEELGRGLAQAGFEALEYFGAYDARTAAGSSDRLVCVASRAETQT